MKRIPSILSILLGVLLTTVLRAESVQDANDLLQSMVQSSKNSNYKGEFVYQQGAHLETMSIMHQSASEDSVEKERIVYLDGAPREVLRIGNELFYSSYNEGVTRFQHGSLIPVVGRLQSGISSALYELKTVGLDRVAGREAILLLVLPKDRFRYGYQLWLDRKSSLLLKSVMLDDQGKVIERLQFTALDTAPLSVDSLKLLSHKPAVVNETITLDTQAEQPNAPLDWETGWLPEGFVLQNRSVRPSPISQHEVDALVFSDGIASFSVFVELDDTRVLSQASEKIGALSAVSKIYREGERYFHVTVVGDVPLSTAERVAVSVRPLKVSP